MIKDDLNPKWNEEWKVKNVPPTAKLNVKIWDKDKIKDDPLGQLNLQFPCASGPKRAMLEELDLGFRDRFDSGSRGELIYEVVQVFFAAVSC